MTQTPEYLEAEILRHTLAKVQHYSPDDTPIGFSNHLPQALSEQVIIKQNNTIIQLLLGLYSRLQTVELLIAQQRPAESITPTIDTAPIVQEVIKYFSSNFKTNQKTQLNRNLANHGIFTE